MKQLWGKQIKMSNFHNGKCATKIYIKFNKHLQVVKIHKAPDKLDF